MPDALLGGNAAIPLALTGPSFIFNASRLVGAFFPILAGGIIDLFGGVVGAAIALSTIYVLGLLVPFALPETNGQGLPG